MTPSPTSQPAAPEPDYAALWSSARQLYPIYIELAREFAIEAPAFAALAEEIDSPDGETVEQAQQWLNKLDEGIQVHQLRQFFQTSSLVDDDGLIALIRHFLGKIPRVASSRDKIDFLLVQHFSHRAPSSLTDDAADIAYVAKELEPLLGPVELKTPVWLNALDRALDAARRCKSLDELLHGGVLEQGRKAKAQAGELFYMPIALVAFTRFGYLMRRAFFRLMHSDLNDILDGLSELEAKGINTIDCRRAQFSAQEPISRLRMICQSWKVMFQAEYSSGQPLRMLVDLRASVDAALRTGGGAPAEAKTPATAQAPKSASTAKVKAVAAAAGVGGAKAVAANTSPAKSASAATVGKPLTKAKVAPPSSGPGSELRPNPRPDLRPDVGSDPPEFEISVAAPEWNPDEDTRPKTRK